MCYHDVAAPGWAPCALAGQVVQMQKCENKATKSREIKDILWWRGFATVAAASGTPIRMARRSPEERATSTHAVSPASRYAESAKTNPLRTSRQVVPGALREGPWKAGGSKNKPITAVGG